MKNHNHNQNHHNCRTVTETHVLLGCASFFTVAFGGLAIGIKMSKCHRFLKKMILLSNSNLVFISGLTFGLLTAVITKFTSGVRVLEPLALLGGSYLAYVTAELFHW